MKFNNKTTISWLFLLVIPLLFLSGCQLRAQKKQVEIPVYVYHNFSPFIIQQKQNPDLSQLFISKLRKKTDLDLVIRPIARTQLNRLIKHQQAVIILWANPKWFKEQADLLVSEPILWDADVVVYNPEQPVTGDYPSAFYHKTFCAIEGHVYRHFSPLLDQHQITRINGNNYSECITKLLDHEVDFMQMEKSQVLNSYQHLMHKKIETFSPNIDNFTRHIMLSPVYNHLLPQVNQVIKGLANDAQWQKDLKKFGENEFIDLFDIKLEDLLKIKPVKSNESVTFD